MITLDKAVLFMDPTQLTGDIEGYLKALGVETRGYTDLWNYLRKCEWGEGKVCFLLRVFVSRALSA